MIGPRKVIETAVVIAACLGVVVGCYAMFAVAGWVGLLGIPLAFGGLWAWEAALTDKWWPF